MSSLLLKLIEKYLEGKRLKGQSMGRVFSRMDGFLWPSARSPWWVTGEKVLSQLWAMSNCSGPFRRRQVDGAYIHSVESSLEAEAPSHEATRLTEQNHAKRRTPREEEIRRWLKTFLSLARERIVIWLSCAKSKGFRKMYFPRNNLKWCIGWQHDIWRYCEWETNRDEGWSERPWPPWGSTSTSQMGCIHKHHWDGTLCTVAERSPPSICPLRQTVCLRPSSDYAHFLSWWATCQMRRLLTVSRYAGCDITSVHNRRRPWRTVSHSKIWWESGWKCSVWSPHDLSHELLTHDLVSHELVSHD